MKTSFWLLIKPLSPLQVTWSDIDNQVQLAWAVLQPLLLLTSLVPIFQQNTAHGRHWLSWPVIKEASRQKLTCHLSPATYQPSPVTCYFSFTTCHMKPVTCHHRQHPQPQPQTLSLIISLLWTEVWFTKTEPHNPKNHPNLKKHPNVLKIKLSSS